MPAGSAANTDTFNVTTPSDREIVLTRLFDAPRRLVFDAMTRPEHVRQWWGRLDDRYSVTVCEIDLRQGGAWRFVGRGPQGEFAFHGVYREIAPPDRLVYTESTTRSPTPSRSSRRCSARRGQDATHDDRAVSDAGRAGCGHQERNGERRRHQLRPAGGPAANATAEVAAAGCRLVWGQISIFYVAPAELENRDLDPTPSDAYRPSTGYPFHSHSSASARVCCFTARSVCPALRTKRNW